jgi:hypothetical protein
MCSDVIKETGQSIIPAGYDFDHFDRAFGFSFPPFRNPVCVIMKSVTDSPFGLSIIVVIAFFAFSRESLICLANIRHPFYAVGRILSFPADIFERYLTKYVLLYVSLMF